MGRITVTSDGMNVTGLYFDGQRGFTGVDCANPEAAIPDILAKTWDWLDGYFTGCNPGTIPCLYTNGTAFQERVWHILREIPCGKVVTYGAIARTLSVSAQAVGGAVGRNPISILIPCHRVVGADGGLTGYAGGLARKQQLLSLEGIPVAGDRVIFTW
ncbi:MAG: methylated-DNA--[protein]-cysteine S-methyltransferase [Clostridiaceae bacterium]|nr:methylated-DNA--[protein]-cysteine S-methyltransferase [Clostridiaceae bacterium]